MTKTETKSTVLVKHHLKQLKLPTMHGECEKVAARSARENLDHLAFLLSLCELELVERERRAAERRLKLAKFPAHKTLDEFDFQAQPSVNKPLVLELIKGDYLDKRENLILVGASGTGKTHLATALGMAACLAGKKVRFFRVTELITTLLEAREEKLLLKLRSQLAKQHLLILDELGYVPASKVGAELLFDIIGTRECLAIDVARKLKSGEVLERLSDLFVRRGVPKYIRSDNGPEFTAKQVREWLGKVGVKTLFIEPGSPWENGYCESFNGRLRDELLAREQFDTMLEAKVLIERWRRHYNTVRPHGSLGYRPPAPEATQPLHFVPATPPLREVAGLTVLQSLT